MKESVTYQAILEEGIVRGRAEGRVEAERGTLLRLGTKKFGPPDPSTTLKLNAITDPPRLSALVTRLLDVSSWAQLLADEP